MATVDDDDDGEEARTYCNRARPLRKTREMLQTKVLTAFKTARKAKEDAVFVVPPAKKRKRKWMPLVEAKCYRFRCLPVKMVLHKSKCNNCF